MPPRAQPDPALYTVHRTNLVNEVPPQGTVRVMVPCLHNHRKYCYSYKFINTHPSKTLKAGALVQFELKNSKASKKLIALTFLPDKADAPTTPDALERPAKVARPSLDTVVQPSTPVEASKVAIAQAIKSVETVLGNLYIAEKAAAERRDAGDDGAPWVVDLGYGVVGPHLGPQVGHLLQCTAKLRRAVALSRKRPEPAAPMERPLMDTPLLARHTAEQRQQRTLRALCMGGESSVMRDAWSVLGALAGWETNRVYDQYSGSQGMSQPGSNPLPAEDGEFVSFLLLLFGDRTQLPRSNSRVFNASDFNATGIMPNQSVLLTALVQQFNESEIVKHILADVERVAHPVLVQAFARLALICNVSQRKWTHIRLREFELVRRALGFRENPMCSFKKVQTEFGRLTKEIRDIMCHCCDDAGNVCVWVD